MLFEMDFLPPALESVGLTNVDLYDNVTKARILSFVSTLWLGPIWDCLSEVDSVALLAEGMVALRLV